MLHKMKYSDISKTLLIVFVLLASQLIAGQMVTGPTSVSENSTHTYSYDDGSTHKLKWTVTGGTIGPKSINGTQYSVTVNWGSAGSGMVSCADGMILLGGLNVVIGSTPPTPTLSAVNQPTCTTATGNFLIINHNSAYTYSASPSTGVSFSGATVTAPPGTYTITATSGSVSSNPSASVTVNAQPSTPGTPPAPTITNNCGNTVLTRGTPPSGVTYYWQSSSSGTSTSNSASTETRTSGTVYYLRARDNSSGCWSTARTVNYTINSLPGTPTAPTVQSTNCGNTVLAKGSSPSGITWYWQSASNGTSTSNSASTVTRTSGTVYYLRARNNTTGCWSTASSSVNYTINSIPATPAAPTITNNCGSTVLTRGSHPSGQTLYWQSSSSGTSTSDSASTVTRTSGTVYYLRARNNTTGCWSTARTVNYTINSVPAIPDMPAITNNCGNTVLTRGTPPSGITWYWQSSSSGTSTTNSASTETRTSGTVYYLRARNNTSGCWSTARTVSYSITQPSTWYADSDGDSYGDPNTSQSACSQPSGYVSNNSDYDDTTVHITNIAPQNFYQDIDGDGFGDPAVSVFYSVAPAGYVTDNTDQCPTIFGVAANNGCPDCSLSDENYVYTIAPRKPTTDVSVGLGYDDKIESVTYFDGLGRPMQSVGMRAGGNRESIVTHIGYDSYGRQDKEFLPYPVSACAAFQSNAESDTKTYYYNANRFANDFTGMTQSTVNPYAEKHLEASPLSRVLEQGAPGKDWALDKQNDTDHTIKFDYQTNTGSEVRRYEAGTTPSTVDNVITYNPTLVLDTGAGNNNGYYQAGALYKTITKDENWTSGTNHTTEEFKDKQGPCGLKAYVWGQ